MNIEFHQDKDQWVILAQIDLDPQWQIMFRNPGRNYADLTKTHGGTQWEPAPIYGQERITGVAQRVIKAAGVKRTISNTWRSWCIYYAAGGYQEAHKHGSALITSVLYFDDDPSLTCLQLGDRILEFPSRKGQFLIFDGLTTHWGTAVQDRKRVLVTDWEYREFDPGAARENLEREAQRGFLGIERSD